MVTPCRTQFGDTAEHNSALQGRTLTLALNHRPMGTFSSSPTEALSKSRDLNNIQAGVKTLIC
jgi:hypothetical protein